MELDDLAVFTVLGFLWLIVYMVIKFWNGEPPFRGLDEINQIDLDFAGLHIGLGSSKPSKRVNRKLGRFFMKAGYGGRLK